ncbi:hypothetical protein KM043_003478 [Ampulex compressa]|nr:hypothetical protein KM043_003478 [Ampulex compressa]
MFVTGSLFIEALAVTCALLVGIYFYYKYVIFDFWRKRGVFCEEPSVPLGHARTLFTGRRPISEFFNEQYKKHKDHGIFGLYILFRPALIIADPDIIRTVLVKEFNSFHDRGMFCNEKTDPLTGHLFLLPGKKWRNLRVKLTPTFTSGKIKQMFLTMRETGDQLSAYLEPKAQARECVDIKDVVGRYATDIIMSVAFGISCNSLENPLNEFRYYGKRAFEPKTVRNSLFLFAPQVLEFFNMTHTDPPTADFFINAFKETIEYREKNNVFRHDFMNLLMQLIKKGYVDPEEDEVDVSKRTETKLTMLEAVAQSYVFFLAGFETSSTTVMFCMYELAQDQRMQDKVREEINTVIKKHGELSYNAVNEMSYLHKVVSETLRKYPPVSVLNRVCTKEVVIPSKDVCIPEGTMTIIPVHGVHHDPSIYPDPEKFDPERFSEEAIAARHPYVYLPFGEGPRICIGLRFGLVQTKIALISTLSKYKFRLSPKIPNPMVYEPGLLILSPRGGMPLIIEPA